MSDTEKKPLGKQEVTLYGSGVWFEAREKEWLVIYSEFAADLFKINRYMNRMVLEKYASTDIHADTADGEIIDALFSKIFPPRDSEQEEQLSE